MAEEKPTLHTIMDELGKIRADQAVIYDVMIGTNGKSKTGDPSLVTKVNEIYPILTSVRGAKYFIITTAAVGGALLWLKTNWPH